MNLSSSNKKEIVKLILAELPSTQAVYLYGSMARNEGRADSDVDIAVVQMQPLDANTVMLLRSKLGVLLGRDIDMLDMRRASTEMAFQALAGSVCLFGGNDVDVAIYETSLMSMYSDLTIERRDILSDVVTRGNVYGS